MSRPKVVVAEPIASSALELLRARCDVELVADLDRDELLRQLADADGVVVRSGVQVDADLMKAAPQLKVVGRAGIGLDNIDKEEAARRGVAVVNVPDASTISVAELTIGFMLSLARRIPEADASLRAGRWERSRLQGSELFGKTLGIIGLGRIGGLVAHRAAAFGMRLLGYDPLIDETRAAEVAAELVSLEDLLEQSDFVTIHAPRLPETEGMIDAAALARMKPTARLINVARGGIVDEKALADAIGNGVIGGAALDVFAVEPVTDSPLFDLPGVVLTPHLGASTAEAQDRAGVAVVEAVLAALSEQPDE